MNNPIKQALLDILDFLRYKVDTNSCTLDEMKQAYKIISEQTVMKATTKDISEFYDQSQSNVRNVINRWGVEGESKRYYNFSKFQKLMPKKWREKSKKESMLNSYATSDEYNMAAEPTPEYGNTTNNN